MYFRIYAYIQMNETSPVSWDVKFIEINQQSIPPVSHISSRAKFFQLYQQIAISASQLSSINRPYGSIGASRIWAYQRQQVSVSLRLNIRWERATYYSSYIPFICQKIESDGRAYDLLHVAAYDGDLDHDPEYQPRNFLVLSEAHLGQMQTRHDSQTGA